MKISMGEIRFVGIFLSFQIFLNIYTFFLIKQ